MAEATDHDRLDWTRACVAGEELWLLPERAAYWPATGTLLVADPHLGKAAAFRAAGVPVPAGTTAQTLARLSTAVRASAATRLIVLGDLLHARAWRAPATLEACTQWRETHAELDVVLVRGNHDRAAGDPPDHWRIACVSQLLEGPFALRHEPRAVRGRYVLAGHTHPAVRLRDADGSTLRAPCFHFGPRIGVLPAFGEFTGAATVRPAPGDEVYAVGPDAVVRVG